MALAFRTEAGEYAGFNLGRGLYMESQTSIPPCLLQARLRSVVLVKNPS